MKKLTRVEQKENTRQGLIQEALRLFSKNGIAVTTTAEVAKAMQISHGTVFIHFPTREDLILGVVDSFGEQLASALGSKFSSEMSLKQMLTAHLHVLSAFEDFYMRLISESPCLSPHIRGQVFAMNSSLSYRFFRAAQALMKTGELKKIDQVHFFNTWMALLHYSIMNRDLLSEQTPILQHKGPDILRNFYSLISTKESK